VAGCCRPLFIGSGRRLEGRAEHAVLVRPAAMSFRPCQRRDVSDVFKAVATWWCCGQDSLGKSVVAGGVGAARPAVCGGVGGAEGDGVGSGVNGGRGIERKRAVSLPVRATRRRGPGAFGRKVRGEGRGVGLGAGTPG
jgi:hypothetical protein